MFPFAVFYTRFSEPMPKFKDELMTIFYCQHLLQLLQLKHLCATCGFCYKGLQRFDVIFTVCKALFTL